MLNLLFFSLECSIRQMKALIHPETTILCVVDPLPNIGSGGATVNAIVHVTEYISALEGHTVSFVYINTYFKFEDGMKHFKYG